ncbi:MAG: hypothetical protein H7X71_00120 [Chitinophagales bacterium]|nr:hypothetical protein [Chitinophagales bacterium]
MTRKYWILHLLGFCIFCTTFVFAEEATAVKQTTNDQTYLAYQDGNNLLSTDYAQPDSPEMAVDMRSSGMIWVVVGVIVIILSGLILYMITVDRKIARIEKEWKGKIDRKL